MSNQPKQRRSRTFVTIGAALCGVFAVGAIGAWWILRSDWLRNEVHARLVAEVERTTGGRVELGGFDYDWHTLTADFHGFVIHGSEPAQSAPLLQIDSLRVRLKVISLLKRDVDIASLEAERPRLALSIAADGSTNVPVPRQAQPQDHTAIEQILALKVKRFDVRHGELRLNDKRVPLELRGSDLGLRLNYRTAGPSYQVILVSKDVQFGSPGFGGGPLELNVRAMLERDRVSVQQFNLARKDLALEAAGAIDHWSEPSANFRIKGQASTAVFARAVGVRDLTGGKLFFAGSGAYHSGSGASFRGKVNGRGLAYRTGYLVLKDADLDTDVTADRTSILFKNLSVRTEGARFAGGGALGQLRNLVIDGHINGVTLAAVAARLSNRPFPWGGSAAGNLHMVGTLDPRAKDFALQATVDVAPLERGLPASGHVELAYSERSANVRFENSQLRLPRSQIVFSGIPGSEMQLQVASSDLAELKAGLDFAGLPLAVENVPALLAGGRARFDGALRGPLSNPEVDGEASLERFRFRGETVDRLRSRFAARFSGVDVKSFDLREGSGLASGSAAIDLADWSVRPEGSLRAQLRFEKWEAGKSVARWTSTAFPATLSTVTGRLQIAGTIRNPQGSGHFDVGALGALGEHFERVQFDAAVQKQQLEVTRGSAVLKDGVFTFSGTYRHSEKGWQDGDAALKLDSNQFPLGDLAWARKYEPNVMAQGQVHMRGSAHVSAGQVRPTGAEGQLEIRAVRIAAVPFGNVLVRVSTGGRVLQAELSGDLQRTQLRGNARIGLAGDSPIEGLVRFDRIDLATLYALSGARLAQPVAGSLQGSLRFAGELVRPERLRATLEVAQIEIGSQLKPDPLTRTATPDLVLRNAAPIFIDAAEGVAKLRSFEIEGKDTRLKATGSIPYLTRKGEKAGTIDLHVDGSVNLQIFHFFDPNVRSSGESKLEAAIGGTWHDPAVSGTLAVKDGSFFFGTIPNGLSAVNGTVDFNRNRATLVKMHARSGGGEMSLGGFFSFGAGGPIVYHLEGNAQGVRVRYAGSISVTASSSLRLSGTSASSILSGTLTVSRVVFNPNTDVGNILSSFGGAAAAPASDSNFLSGLQLDIAIESAPNLQLSTALSRDVEAEINLRLRGTPDHPVLLGGLAANQGDIKVFGTRYSINRGEVNFLNSVKIEPVLDLDLETQARGITVDITISGAINKLNINYRSDPPLQPRDIIALLTVGRAPSIGGAVNSTSGAGDVGALQPGANTVLGAAASPVSNRLSKLFGITNIKIDPLVQGITNTPQARLTLEQQISRDITVTYVTNLSQTSEQIFRLEWALNRQFSLVALRDDNGEFGIDFQYKKRFK